MLIEARQYIDGEWTNRVLMEYPNAKLTQYNLRSIYKPRGTSLVHIGSSNGTMDKFFVLLNSWWYDIQVDYFEGPGKGMPVKVRVQGWPKSTNKSKEIVDLVARDMVGILGLRYNTQFKMERKQVWGRYFDFMFAEVL